MGNSTSSSSFPYTLLDIQHTATKSFPWAIHSGTQKSDNAPVTVFKLSKQSINHPYILQAATQHYTKSKTLIHPHVLRTFGTLDTDEGSSNNLGELIIVTEEVMPLRSYLEMMSGEEQSDNVYNAIAWGLYCIIHALHFLHDTAKVQHGLVTMDSIYVTKGGDWKLGNFGLLTSIEARGVSFHFRECDEMVCAAMYRSPERVGRRWEEITSTNMVDSYSFGVTVEEIYRAVGNGRVPDVLVKAVARLKTSNARARPRVFPLLKCPLFASNPLVNSLKILEEYAAKPTEEKIAFLQSLPDSLSRGSYYGKNIAQYKLLPELLQSLELLINDPAGMSQDIVRREVMAILPLLFLIVEKCPPEKSFFELKISPAVCTLFTVNDRGVRGALLNRTTLLLPYMDKKTMNTKVFEPMCSGFTDSSAPLRELTLKSTLPLVEHLNPTSLEKLTRYLIRLQADSEPSIRTNTIIFIGKILPQLGKEAREKIFFSSFSRALKDDFTPCRLASIKMVISCKEYMGVDNAANKLLPLIIPYCLDKDAQVRKDTMSAVDIFMKDLKEECNNRNRANDDDMAQFGDMSNTQVESAPTSSGSAGNSYFSGFTSYFSSTTIDSDKNHGEMSSINAPAKTPVTTTAPAPAASNYGSYSSKTTAVPSYSSYNPPATATVEDSWSDDDDLIGLDDSPPPKTYPSHQTYTPQQTYNKPNEDPFASIGTSNIAAMHKNRGKLVISKPKREGNKGTGSLKERKEAYERRKAQRDKPVSDGWDDF